MAQRKPLTFHFISERWYFSWGVQVQKTCQNTLLRFFTGKIRVWPWIFKALNINKQPLRPERGPPGTAPPQFVHFTLMHEIVWWNSLLLLSHFSRVRLCATPQMAAHQAPPSLDSPGKNTGVGCHFLLQCMKVKSESEVTQSCPTLSDPMDCSLPGSSNHGIFRARVLEWGAIAFSGWNSLVTKKTDPFGYWLGSPGGSDSKECACNAGDWYYDAPGTVLYMD